MTRDAIRTADPALAAALDRLPMPPPLRPDFPDRVVARAGRKRLPRIQGPRRPWARGHGMTFGVIALALASAAAAGIAGFTPRVFHVPAIERLIHKVTNGNGVAPAQPQPVRVAVGRPVHAPPKAPAELSADVHAAPSEETADEPAAARAASHRERIAPRIRVSADPQVQRRATLRLPVRVLARDANRPPSARAMSREAERAAQGERVQDVRTGRVETAARVATPASPPVQAAPSGAERLATSWRDLSWRERREALQSLDPADRQAVLNRLGENRREELLRRRAERPFENGRPQRMERRSGRRLREGFFRNRR